MRLCVLNYMMTLLFILNVFLVCCGIKGPPRPPLVEDAHTQNNKFNESTTLIKPTKKLIVEPSSKDNSKTK